MARYDDTCRLRVLFADICIMGGEPIVTVTVVNLVSWVAWNSNLPQHWEDR